MAYSDFNRELGKKIFDYRTEAKLSQKEFADMIGLTNRATLSLIENGEQAPSLEVLTNIIRITKLDINKLLDVKIRNAVVVDTNVILNRPEILDLLVKDCDEVYIPRRVISELNYQKDNGREKVKRNVSLCMSKINEMKSEQFIIKKSSREFQNADDEILQVAKDLALSDDSYMVYMLSDDKDFQLKDLEDIINLKVITTREYNKIFVEPDGYNEAASHSFYMAVVHRNIEQAKSLIAKKGKYINVNYIDSKSGFTPLIKAIKQRDYGMVEYLLTLDRIDIDAVDDFKHHIPPLSHAIQAHDNYLVELLVAHNANVNEPAQSKTNSFNTPLMIAAWEDQFKTVRLLVENGAIINQQDQKNGFTALIKAVFRDRNDIAQYLLDSGADPRIMSYERMTALDYAYKNKNKELIEMLKKVQE